MHNAYMAKSAAITIRLPEALKRRIQARAKRDRRSLSSQVLHELEKMDSSPDTPAEGGGQFLGRFAGSKIPTDSDLSEVRATLWKRLTRPVGRRG
jgi:hypothetical protein